VQAAVLNRFMTEPFEFFFEMQHTALEINDHQSSNAAELR